MNKVMIAKQLIKLAKEMVKLQSNKFYIRSKKGELHLDIDSESWSLFGKKPEWIEIVDVLDEYCKGKFYGIDHSCFKKKTDGREYGILTFENEQRKSPEAMIRQNLKRLQFIQEKF